MKGVTTAVVALLATALLGGCSEAPVVEENAAVQSLSSAEQVQAAKYAPSEWQMAQDTMLAAKAARVEQDGRFAPLRSYTKSKEMFERATQMAEVAENKATSEMSRIRAETETLLSQTRMELDSLAILTSKLPTAKDSKAEIELMKQDVAAYQQQLQDAKADFDRADYESAMNKAQTARERGAAMMDTIRSLKTAKIKPRKA